jgi:hypothetical protein
MDVPLGLINQSFFSHRPFIPIARILSTAYSFSSSSDQPDSVVLANDLAEIVAIESPAREIEWKMRQSAWLKE